MRKCTPPVFSAGLVEQAPVLVKHFGKWPAYIYIVLATVCRPVVACIVLLSILLLRPFR